MHRRFSGLKRWGATVGAETKNHALLLESRKALPAQNCGIIAEWQGDKQHTGGDGGLFVCGKKKRVTNGSGRGVYTGPKG